MQSQITQPSRPQPFWLGLVLLFMGLGVGGLLVWLSSRPPSANSPEVEFARAMSVHHEQAIEMALILRERSQDPVLSPFALDILLTQRGQMGQMYAWLSLWGHPTESPTGVSKEHAQSMGMASNAEMAQLRSLPLAQAEILFMQLMLRHHQGGVAMAQNALDKARHPEVQRLASSMVNGQQNEIRFMTTLLQERGASPLPAPPAPANHSSH